MQANRVLVVGKDETHAKAGVAKIAADKFTLVEGASWTEALPLASSGRYQLVIVLAGAEIGIAAVTTFARSAERWAQREDMMLVALTEDGTAALHRDLQHAGFDDIIHRPMHPTQVASRVAILLRLSTMRRELARRQATARGFTSGDGLFLAPAEPVIASRRASVLLVQFDQSAHCAEQFNRAVRSCTEATICDDPEAARAQLYRGGLDAVLLCSAVDPKSAIDFADRMRRVPALYNLPVLLATPDVEKLDLDMVFNAGITDVAPTCLSSEQLSVHLTSFKRLEALRAALAARYAQHVEMVIRDGLTGFADHGFGMAHLQSTLRDCAELSLPVAIGGLTIENLDEINAAHGYLAGDIVMRRVGDMVRRCIRGEDMATRLSGSRILVQFPDTRYASANVAIRRLANVLRFQKIDLPGGASIALRIGYTLACWDGDADARTLVASLKARKVAVAA